MTIEARVVRKTPRGDWVARTDSGVEVLLSNRGEDLPVGTEVYFGGIRPGRNIHFPIGVYTAKSSAIPSSAPSLERGVIDVGIIYDDHINFGGVDDHAYWEALTNKGGSTNLSKNKDSSNIDIGTMIDIHRVRKQGVRHRFIDEWSVSSVQYPQQPLTDSQRDLASRLNDGSFHGNARVGTIALIDGYGMAIIPDEKFMDRGIYRAPREARHVFKLWSGTRDQENFPIGTRVIYGSMSDSPLDQRAFRL